MFSGCNWLKVGTTDWRGRFRLPVFSFVLGLVVDQENVDGCRSGAVVDGFIGMKGPIFYLVWNKFCLCSVTVICL